MIKADLHLHSIYSDGADSPARLAEIAKESGLNLISLTDHDCVDGISEMTAEGKKAGIEVFPGIELSCFASCEIHILGYNFDADDPELRSELSKLQSMRESRTAEILQKLEPLGMFIDAGEVYAQKDTRAPGSTIGRVHIAKALVKKGYAKDVNDAFNRWLASGKAAYVPSFRLTPSQGIALIKRAGGKAVLAHPHLIALSQETMYSLVKSMKSGGLDGIEAVYSAHTTTENKFYVQLAAKFDLFVTCGSDYHGACRPNTVTPYLLSEEDYKRLKD